MSEYKILLPSQPKVVSEEGNQGVFEISGLYPGYGHTLGNSLRRIILSSLPGSAITSMKIKDADHEFSTVPGLKEDVIKLILNFRKVRFNLLLDEPQKATLKVKGPKKIYAKDIDLPGQMEMLTPDMYIAELTDSSELDMEITLEKGLGYASKESLTKEKVDIGTIALDASFTPIRRVNYEVEDMRVGERTDHNLLRVMIETDGTLTPKQALSDAIEIMISQLNAIVGFQEPTLEKEAEEEVTEESEEKEEKDQDDDPTKTKIEELNFSTRTANALDGANIRTIGGLIRKTDQDLLDLDGLGEKGLKEIKQALSNFGLTLKQE